MSNQSTAVATSTPANGRMPDGREDPPPHAVPAQQSMGAPARLFEHEGRSQATQIEQARVVAEVQAAIVVAQQRPRDIERALIEMRKVCTIEMMAERAFYAFDKGGTTANGGSIHLARELGRIWGNVTYGMKELDRKDARPGEEYGQSEMLAYAWDLQTNTRPETTFIVPHYIDLKGGRKKFLKDSRSIYENNSNMGARRLREQIFAVIPRWFRDEAEDICRQTLEHGGGVPFKKRLDILFDVATSLGVTEAMITKKLNKSVINLTAADLADLKIVFRSLKNGEIAKDEAFPETPAADLDAHLQSKVDATATKAVPQVNNAPPQSQGPQTTQAAQQAAPAPAAAPNPMQSTANRLIAAINATGTLTALKALMSKEAEDLDLLRTDAPDLYAQCTAVIDDRKKHFAR